MNVSKDKSRLERRVRLLTDRADRIAGWRLLLFLVSAAFGLVAGMAGWSNGFQVATAFGFTAFAVFVYLHDRVSQTLVLFQKRLETAGRLEALTLLDWAKIPHLPPIADRRRMPRVFSDLDLIDGNALLRLVNQTASTEGFKKLLARFDGGSVSSHEIEKRRALVAQMVRPRVLRRRFLVVEALWAGLIESDRIIELLSHPLHTAKAAAYFAFVFAVQFTFLALFAWFSFTGGTPYFLLAGLGLLIAYRLAAKHVRLLQAYDYGLALDVSLGKFAALAEVLGRLSKTRSTELANLLAPFHAENNPRAVLARMGRVVGFLGVRQNYILHLALNLAMPWDFFWTLQLERLRNEVKDRVPLWLETLAELEVILSLAEFEVTRPGFAPADISDKHPFYIKAEGLAHPLLPETLRVGNSIQLDSEQRLLLITGSNMSGKSTFLRSIGVNLLLARAGAPVCAKLFQARNLELATSLRLNDSLEDGLSSFYAEVRQLKSILDLAEGGHPLLYLIDEVFRGTNNRERLAGSQAFAKTLAQTGACGLITTHDLELASLADATPSIRNYHFKETMEGDRMSFTFNLAQGPCPTTNALRVMKLAGLPISMLFALLSSWLFASCASVGNPRTSVEQILLQSRSVGQVLDAEERAQYQEQGRNPASPLKPVFQQPLKGYRVDSAFGERSSGFHQGIDYRADLKTPVYASEKGEVVFAARNISGYGETIIMRHIGGYSTLYAHLLEVHVEVGERIEKGQFIAYSGESGNATGPHLHFELREGSQAINPAPFLKNARNF